MTVGIGGRAGGSAQLDDVALTTECLEQPRRPESPWTASAMAAPTVALVRSASLSPSTLPMNPLREWPTSTGQPSSWNRWQLRQQRQVVLVRLAEADARIEADPLASMPAATSASRRSRR